MTVPTDEIDRKSQKFEYARCFSGPTYQSNKSFTQGFKGILSNSL